MKVLAINGSARKDGNTAILVRLVLKELEAEGIETEFVQLAGKSIPGCIACYKCFEKKDGHCAVKKDGINELIDKMVAADGIILASPTYFADVTSNMKSVMDRCGLVSRANGGLYDRKVGAAVAAVRRAGALHVLDTLNHFFLANQFMMPGSSYWNLAYGRNIGEVEGDAEGLKTMTDLGKNMAWMLKKLNA